MENDKGTRTTRVTVEFRGLPAYVLQELATTGIYGRTPADVTENIVSEWVMARLDDLNSMVITHKRAVQEGYIRKRE